MEENITLLELFAAVIRGWKKVLASALIFTFLLGSFQIIRLVSEMKTPENSPEEIEKRYEDAMNTYELQKKNLETNLRNKESELETEQEYVDNSILMKLDPYNEYVTYVYLAISDIDESSLQQVVNQETIPIDYFTYKIRSQYLAIWKTLDLSESLNLPPDLKVADKYLQEIITLEATEGSLLKISGHGESASKSKQLADAVYTCLLEHQGAVIEGSYFHQFSILNQTTKTIVNMSLRDTQKQHLDSIETLTTSKSDLQTQLDELAVPEREELLSATTILKSTLKYAILGAAVGLFLACFCIVIITIFSNRAISSFQLAHLLSLPFLGSGKVPGQLDRFANRIIGERNWNSQEDAILYIIEQIKALIPAGSQVLILSTLPEKRAATTIATLQATASSAGYPIQIVYDASRSAKTVEAIQKANCILFAETTKHTNLIDVNCVLEQIKLYKKNAVGFIMI